MRSAPPDERTACAERPSPHRAHSGWHWRLWAAEGGGTALLVLGGLSAVCLDFGRNSPVADGIPSHSARLLLTGLLFAGCGSLVAVSPLGRLSGAHLNPAVTLAFRTIGMVSPHDVAGYLLAQVVGAAAGALLLRLAWGHVALSVGGGVTHPTVTAPLAVALEAAMTALLVAVIFFFVSSERRARWTPLALWPLIATLVWQGADYTGTSLNPARSVGPALAFVSFTHLWIYLVAPTAGALVAATLWRLHSGTRQPMTAKIFHDPRYVSSFATELPAMSPAGR